MTGRHGRDFRRQQQCQRRVLQQRQRVFSRGCGHNIGGGGGQWGLAKSDEAPRAKWGMKDKGTAAGGGIDSGKATETALTRRGGTKRSTEAAPTRRGRSMRGMALLGLRQCCRQRTERSAEETGGRSEVGGGGRWRYRAAPSCLPPWWCQCLFRVRKAFQKTLGGGVDFNGFFGTDGLYPSGRARACSPGSGSTDQRGNSGETIGGHDQRYDDGGEDGIPHQRGGKRVRGLTGSGGARAGDPLNN